MTPATAPKRDRALARGFAAAAVALALCAGGLISLMQGIGVPVRADLAQARLERTFEQHLARNLAAAGAGAETADHKRPDAPVPAPVPATPSHPGRLPAATQQAPAPVARLTVARLGIREIIVAGDGSHEQLAQGPTMIRQGDADSPVTILAAHRDTHFLFIRDLRAGDVISVQSVTGPTDRYRVTHFETVRWNRFTYPLNPARPLLALTTCFPFGGTEYGGPWRRVAWAEHID